MIVVENSIELKRIIKQRISEQGPNCNLNDIDVSKVKDMSWMFFGLQFNGDISNWNVSSLLNMQRMFCDSKFNGDISRWNISSKTGPWSMNGMFDKSPLDGKESSWYKEK